MDVRRGTLRTERVKRPDGHGYQLVGHPVQKFASVPGIIARARKRKQLLEPEAEFLRGFLIETIGGETYREWLSSFGFATHFFYEHNWNDRENHRKFALYAVACFVDFFRPGMLDWQTPNQDDMRLVAKISRIFAEVRDARKQRKLLQGLFDLRQDLRAVAVESAIRLSREDQELLLQCHSLGLKEEERARWLQEHRFKGFGKSPLTKYRENPNSMRAQLSKWTREVLED